MTPDKNRYSAFLMDDGVVLGRTVVHAASDGVLPELLVDPPGEDGEPVQGTFTLDQVNNAAFLAHYEIED